MRLARERAETWLSDVHPDDRATQERVIAPDAADSSGLYQSEFRVSTASGEYKWLLDRRRVVERAPDGAPREVMGIVGCKSREYSGVSERSHR
jgi:PAS domain-containing protein